MTYKRVARVCQRQLSFLFLLVCSCGPFELFSGTPNPVSTPMKVCLGHWNGPCYRRKPSLVNECVRGDPGFQRMHSAVTGGQGGSEKPADTH